VHLWAFLCVFLCRYGAAAVFDCARRGELGSFRFSWLLAGVDAPVSGASTNSILQAGHKGFGAAVAATH
jgi:hypothetical protein